MKKILLLAIIFGAFWSNAQITRTELDGLGVDTKYYLFRDIFSFIESNDTCERTDLGYLVENISKKNAVDFFPYIIDNQFERYKESKILNEYLNQSDDKEFRKHIVSNLTIQDGEQLAQDLMDFTLELANKNNEPEMASKFYSEGKIYVVVTVLSLILSGIVLYLILLNRKVNQLNK